MAIEIIHPTDRVAWLRARKRDVTASAVGALFGEHEFYTLMDVWADKTGRIPTTIEETPAMQRGRLLEPVAIALMREKYPEWEIHHNAAANIYYRDTDARLGGTPDAIVRAPGRGKGVVQIKSVEASVYRHKWLDGEGYAEAPVWIALQASLEAYLTGADWAAVAPLIVGHGLDMPLVEVPLIDGVVDAMKAKSAEFWRMVEEGRQPPADFARDGALIERLYAFGDESHEIDLTGNNRIRNLMVERAVLKAEAGDALDRVEEIDTEIKATLGNAFVAHIGDGRRITWKPQKRAGFFVEPKITRVLRYPAEKET